MAPLHDIQHKAAQISEHLRNKRWDEASKAIDEAFSVSEYSAVDEADAYITLVGVHLEVLNHINREYLSAVQSAILLTKTVHAGTRKIEEEIDLGRLKRQIDELIHKKDRA
jgi:hypothetical protein